MQNKIYFRIYGEMYVVDLEQTMYFGAVEIQWGFIFQNP